MTTVSLPPGTSDIFPDEALRWREIENTAQRIFSLYGYGELRTPIMEFTELFQRSIGNETDVVKKEMYTFEDNGGRSLTLRPEGTAGVMRALAGTDVMNGTEKRVFYMGAMFRGEKPAAGRKRQFNQIGVENAGTITPAGDAESIAMLMHFLKEVNISGTTLLINTRGAFEDRQPAEELLRKFFTKKLDSLCNDCKDRLNRNVWRIIDCKQVQCGEIVAGLPDITNSFSQESRDYFASVCKSLDDLKVDYEIDSRLVRGLDYYAHTVFEVTHPGLGAQNSIAGGGRYEVSVPGLKRPVVGVGFALGIERLLMVQDSLETGSCFNIHPEVFVISLGESAKSANIKLAMSLRNNGISCIAELENKSMKAQMRAANRLSAKFVIIRGDTEIEKKTLVCKNLDSGEQHEMSEESLMDFLKTFGE
jgi:histidyl-tRNA synthetase